MCVGKKNGCNGDFDDPVRCRLFGMIDCHTFTFKHTFTQLIEGCKLDPSSAVDRTAVASGLRSLMHDQHAVFMHSDGTLYPAV